MEKLIEDEQAGIKVSMKVSALGKSVEVDVTTDRLASGEVFNDVMEAIGFKFVRGGDCRTCDAKFICERVERFTNSFCFSYAEKIGAVSGGSYLGKH